MAWHKRTAFYGSVNFRGWLFTGREENRHPHGVVYFRADPEVVGLPDVLYLYAERSTESKILGAVRPAHETLRGMNRKAEA